MKLTRIGVICLVNGMWINESEGSLMVFSLLNFLTLFKILRYAQNDIIRQDSFLL